MQMEPGAHEGMIAPVQTTFDYIKGRPHAPKGEDWDAAVEYWKTLRTDDDAVFDSEVVLDASELERSVTWGTNAGQGQPLSGSHPPPADIADESARAAAARALEYQGLTGGTPRRDTKVA